MSLDSVLKSWLQNQDGIKHEILVEILKSYFNWLYSNELYDARFIISLMIWFDKDWYYFSPRTDCYTTSFQISMYNQDQFNYFKSLFEKYFKLKEFL